jgi:hypothetical protein
MYFFRWLKWKLDGSPMTTYPGGNCGCCGVWVNKSISVPAFTANQWFDTWTLCERCIGKVEKIMKNNLTDNVKKMD